MGVVPFNYVGCCNITRRQLGRPGCKHPTDLLPYHLPFLLLYPFVFPNITRVKSVLCQSEHIIPWCQVKHCCWWNKVPAPPDGTWSPHLFLPLPPLPTETPHHRFLLHCFAIPLLYLAHFSFMTQFGVFFPWETFSHPSSTVPTLTTSSPYPGGLKVLPFTHST